jgi:hypothetical protein
LKTNGKPLNEGSHHTLYFKVPTTSR